jgi:hypothetical protein
MRILDVGLPGKNDPACTQLDQIKEAYLLLTGYNDEEEYSDFEYAEHLQLEA